jgi:hypothetical protein
VRVEVEQGQGLLILDVTAGERWNAPSTDGEYEKHKAAYDALVEEKKKASARLANCLSELSLFLEKESLASRDQPGKFLPVNLQGWKEFFSFLRERLASNRALYREQLFMLVELEKKITAATANLSRLQETREEGHEITVRVEAPRAADFSLSLSYLHDGVFWYPVYAVSGDPSEKSCTVSLSAVIGQGTGEDWRDVEIMLSTAVPMFSCSIPVLSSRRLREADAVIELKKAAPLGEAYADMAEEAMKESEAPSERARAPKRDAMRKEKRSMSAGAPADAKTVASMAAPSPIVADKAFRKKDRPHAVVEEPAFDAGASPPADLRVVVNKLEAQLSRPMDELKADPYAEALFRIAGGRLFESTPEPPAQETALPGWMARAVSPLESLGGYDYRFAVAGRRDVPSSPVPQKVPVARKLLAATFVYVTVPAVKEAVFLKTLFSNDGENPLPAGPAQVFAGDTLIGALDFPTLGPGERGALSLGAERDIKVLRREKSARRRRGVVSKEVITDFTVEIELISFKDDEATVEVYDRLPVSRQPKEISVGDFKSTPNARVSERKVLSWTLTLAPRKKAMIEFRYSIRHPADFRIALEEDPVAFQMGKEE